MNAPPIYSRVPFVVAGLISLMVLCVPGTSASQEMRGTVLQPGGSRPASGVVVVMLDANRNDSIVARVVTGDRGTYSLNAPAARAVTVRVLRVGFMPITVGTFRFEANEIRTKLIELENNRVAIPTVAISQKSRCESQSQASRLVAQLFEQARTALLSTTSEVSGAHARAEVVNFIRNEDKLGQLIGDVQREVVTGPTGRPYGSPPPEMLAKSGYLFEQNGRTMLWAPDAEVLISNSFARTHCLFLVKPEDTNSSSIGLGFRPLKFDRTRVDARGTLWMDRKTAELQFLEFEYEPLHPDYRVLRIGGRVGYKQTVNGGWFVSDWSVRMPRESKHLLRPDMSRPFGDSLVGVQTVGGEVKSIKHDGVVSYSSTSSANSARTAGDVLQLKFTAGALEQVQKPETTIVETAVSKNAPRELAANATLRADVPEVMPTDPRKTALFIKNEVGQPIPFATVFVNGGVAQLADSSGRLVLNLQDRSVRIMIRRLGFVPFDGVLQRDDETKPFRMELKQAAQSLARIDVTGKREKSSLERTGFYARMTEVQKGAIVGEFFTPEMLEMRETANLTNILRASRFVQVNRDRRGDVLVGRSPTSASGGGDGCQMNIFLDGVRMSGSPLYVDQFVNGAQIAAIEVYRSSANAPATFMSSSMGQNCGVVAIWTGSKRP